MRREGLRLYLSFRVSVAGQNFRIGARDARTTTKAQMRRAAVNVFDVEEKRLCANDASAAHSRSPGICVGFRTARTAKTYYLSET
jgi:hypothetical protein